MQAKVLLTGIAGFMCGVFIASLFDVALLLSSIVTVVSPFLIVVFWKYKKIRYSVLFILCFALGTLRFNAVADSYLNNKLNAYLPLEVYFEAGIIEAEMREMKQVLVVSPISEVTLPGGHILEKDSKTRLTTDSFTKYLPGERVFIEGVLEEPENFTDEFDWRGYLAKEGIKHVMYNPKIEKINIEQPTAYYLLDRPRSMLLSGIEQSLLPPHSSLYKAMVAGDKTALRDNEREALQRAGLSHIVAISGMHIAIITMVLVSMLIGLGLWRQHALYLTISILVFYILVIGAPASAGRAGIMAAVAILAEGLGRPNSSWRALVLAAGAMVLFNPLILRHDVGFQLSFLAVLGIILLSDKIFNFFQSIWNKIAPKVFSGHITKDRPLIYFGYERILSGIGGMASGTIAAQVFTFPVIMYHFGYLSPWSLFSNMLVLPVLPYALGSGIIASLGGVAGGIGSALFAAPAWFISSYIWFVVDVFNLNGFV